MRHVTVGLFATTLFLLSLSCDFFAPPTLSFNMSLDGSPEGSVSANGSVTLKGIALGVHQVHLSVPSGLCSRFDFLIRPPDQSVIVSPASVATVRFKVVCL